jgi:transposase
LLGISKRGDAYLRTLLIHGARSALRAAGDKPDRLLRWAVTVQARRGTNVAAVALANKMARVAWALLAHDRDYDPAHAGKRAGAAATPAQA